MPLSIQILAVYIGLLSLPIIFPRKNKNLRSLLSFNPVEYCMSNLLFAYMLHLMYVEHAQLEVYAYWFILILSLFVPPWLSYRYRKFK